MQLHGCFQPVVGTFLVFSDYQRNALRLAALMKQRVIFVFSHDSILLAEDGPTHQPVEQLMSLRLIPNLTLIRPGDENEVKAAWAAAFRIQDGPVAICITRQPVKSTVSNPVESKARRGVERGAYIIWGSEDGPLDALILATGSELPVAVEAARLLSEAKRRVRVVSMPSWELFDKQDETYRERVIGGNARLRVSVEAGSSLGWQKYIGTDGLAVALDSFGASAPTATLAEYYGFTAESIVRRILERLDA
jgi:transketolase